MEFSCVPSCPRNNIPKARQSLADFYEFSFNYVVILLIRCWGLRDCKMYWTRNSLTSQIIGYRVCHPAHAPDLTNRLLWFDGFIADEVGYPRSCWARRLAECFPFQSKTFDSLDRRSAWNKPPLIFCIYRTEGSNAGLASNKRFVVIA